MIALTAVIIEDEHKLREVFIQLLIENCPQITVLGDAGNITEGYRLINEKKPNVVFLDIEMPGGNGFELLAKFEKPFFETIFVSSYGHYAIQALKLSALDYILKPVMIEELKKIPDRLEEIIELKESALKYQLLQKNLKNVASEKQLVIRSKSKLETFNLKDIIYLNAEGNYTFVYIKGYNRQVVSKPLKDYEDMLCEDDGTPFIRIHKAYIVNLNFIKKIERGDACFVLLKDDTRLEVSRRKKNLLIEKFHSLTSGRF